ncbi:MAG: rhodanese-like domain-containing protein [Verrucomicrobiales bacterium]
MKTPAEPAPDAFTVDSPMDGLMAAWPGARRALFARYHIGGCSSCGFQPGESLAEVCARHEVDPAESLDHLREAAVADAALLISPAEAKTLLDGENAPVLIDLRTREEHDAVRLPGSLFFTEDLQREAFATWDKNRSIILYDHSGGRSLDMAAWFAGHGLRATRALAGGIDAWSREVDRTVPRYRIEMES